MPYHEAVILERRELGELAMLILHAPELARGARPGQAVLVRCAPAGAEDPLLRRALFLAGADGAAGVVELLVAPEETALAWLAAQPVGARLDLYGPVGAGFVVDSRSGQLLLAGMGPALPALVFVARSTAARAAALVLIAAGAPARLPPPYLLPPEVEYHTGADLIALLAPVPDRARGRPGASQSLSEQPLSPAHALPSERSERVAPAPIAWADQVFLALTEPLAMPVAELVRAGRLRWGRGFAQVALAGAMPCGLGTCLACPVETRDGPRLRCKEGPVFDLRDLRA